MDNRGAGLRLVNKSCAFLRLVPEYHRITWAGVDFVDHSSCHVIFMVLNKNCFIFN